MNLKALLPLTLGLLLASCNSTPLDEVPDNPPYVAVAEINGVNGRKPVDGLIRAPAAEMFNPNTGQVEGNSVPLLITASDERQVTRVKATLRQDGAETWSRELTLEMDEEIFNNPFTFFNVPFAGSDTGIVQAELEIVAMDDANQTNEPYRARIGVDGSLPFLSADVPAGEDGEVSGIISIFAQASDPESDITSLRAFLDEEQIDNGAIGGFTRASFSTSIDTNDLENGPHFITFIARNGVNESVQETFRIFVLNEEDEDPLP